MKTMIAALSAAILMMGSPLSAEIIPKSRNSEVFVTETYIDLVGNVLGTDTFSMATNTPDPFDEQVSTSGYAARQVSSVTTTGALVELMAGGNPSTQGFGSASSSFQFVFDVLEPHDFTLEGNVNGNIGFGRVQLVGPGFDFLEEESNLAGRDYFLAGILRAGSYTLSVEATSDFGVATASLRTFPVPAPAVGTMALTMLGSYLVWVRHRNEKKHCRSRQHNRRTSS
jgi:hypothetical protein